ncbi:MAG: FG-GAP-like repeat-containing protein [Bacteroidota bacterium]
MMKNFVPLYMLLSLAFPFCLSAQYGPEQTVLVRADIEQLASGDMDGDGDLDLVAAFRLSDRVVWLERLDDSLNYSKPKIIGSNFETVIAIELADIDRDGDLDVMAASWRESKIIWYENFGGGERFSKAKTIAEGIDDPSAYALGDMDGDGDLDVINASKNGRVDWYENVDTLKTFNSARRYVGAHRFSVDQVDAIDMNGDGAQDILATGNAGMIYFRNLGDGRFSRDLVPIANLSGGIQFFSYGDINNDSLPDLVMVGESSHEISWLENDGMGGFEASQPIAQYDSRPYIYLADVNGDKLKDLLTITYEGRVNWHANLDGQGNFGLPQLLSTAFFGGRLIYAEDLDGDGDMEILAGAQWQTSNQVTRQLYYFENYDGRGNFRSGKSMLDQAFAVNFVETTDVDSDGDLDLVTSSSVDNRVTWYPNLDGKGNFGSQNVISINAQFAQCVAAADLDGDGHTDVVVPSNRSPYLSWHKNMDGQGTFGGERRISTPQTYPFFVRTTDMDGDGDQDLLTVERDDGWVLWYENVDGQGNFDNYTMISQEVRGAAAAIAEDVDGDGDRDVIVASSEDDMLSWFENTDGKGNFGPRNIISDTINFAVSVDAADLDGDGDKDLLALSLIPDGKVYWVENEDGKGAFGAPQMITSGLDYPRYITASDIELDGDQDILVSIRNENRVVAYENLDGLGTFDQEREVASQLQGMAHITTADLDGDLDLDLVTTSYIDSKLAWFENLLGKPIIRGNCFLDQNANGQRDGDEPVLIDQRVEVQPSELTLWPSGEGQFIFAVDTGSYEVQYLQDTLWTLTSDSVVQMQVGFRDTAEFAFGLIPRDTLCNVRLSINSAPTRCGFEVPFWLGIHNEGTVVADGWLCAVLNDSLQFLSASVAPDSTRNDTLYWRIDQLVPSQSRRVELRLQMPGVDNIGQTIDVHTFATLDKMDTVLTVQSLYTSTIRCAYDPNDKLVLPQGPEPENFTLFGDTLLYTIRFQNTGNDTAFNVRLEDTLDVLLDWATFEPLASSHSYQTSLNDEGLLVFYFDNILLPDSNVNEAASHGFVQFRILPKADLPKGTVIQNTAYIYFDFNPPIITNTVVNTLTDQILSTQTRPSLSPLVIEQFELFPNPSRGRVVCRLKIAEGHSWHLSVKDLRGITLQEIHRPSGGTMDANLYLPDLPAGVYFVQLQSEGELQSRRLLLLR